MYDTDYCPDNDRPYCYLTFLNKIKPHALMYHIAPQRMVLEGIITEYRPYTFVFLSTYTQVRHYEDWLDQNMKM